MATVQLLKRDHLYFMTMRHYLLNPLHTLFFLTLVFSSHSANAMTLDDQRTLYEDAKKALDTGRIARFLDMAEQLQEYPLYPYLRYNYLSTRLNERPAEEIRSFLREYDDFPLRETLQKKLLRSLAKKQQWTTYLESYTPQQDILLRCYELQARLHTGDNAGLLEESRSVWLAGKSLPPQCDPAFAVLYKSDLMTNELIWERIRLAMEQGNTGLANYLSRRLEGDYKKWAAEWIAMHKNPEALTRKASFADNAMAREILLHGIKQLARTNINRAIINWENLRAQYEFSVADISEMNSLIAVRAARMKHPRSKELLDKIDNHRVNEDVFHWRLRTALANHDWETLRKWTTGDASIETIRLRWIYWQARALEQTGEVEKAREVYAKIANLREYYGFLAADRLGIPYSMNHTPLPVTLEDKQKMQARPGLQRAQELRALDKDFQARLEWHHALGLMSDTEKEIAASLAVDWGWHDRAIFTVSAAQSYDDLTLRFPLLFQDIIDSHVEKQQLDPGWVYALIRSESAFMEQVKSPVGAVGLMQVMPATGKLTARKLGIKGFQPSDLLQAEKNIPIGSAYLREMLDKFNGNRILATAAYNAGPNRIKRWLPKQGCVEPDIWVEQIPFDETWKYVRRVLFYASIYDWRLQQPIMPLKERMATVGASNPLDIAALSCSGERLTHN